MNATPEKPISYLITTGEATPSNFLESRNEILNTLRCAVKARVSLIQIREKQLDARQLYELSFEATKITSGTETRLLINSRADIAVAAGADGVHLPEDGLPVDAVRQMFPPPFTVGASVHSVEAAIAAKNDGADFTVFGPVFETPGKSEAKGLDELRRVCNAVPGFRVLAVGGIERANYRNVLEFGASGFAAIRFLNDHQALRDLENGTLSF